MSHSLRITFEGSASRGPLTLYDTTSPSPQVASLDHSAVAAGEAARGVILQPAATEPPVQQLPLSASHGQSAVAADEAVRGVILQPAATESPVQQLPPSASLDHRAVAAGEAAEGVMQRPAVPVRQMPWEHFLVTNPLSIIWKVQAKYVLGDLWYGVAPTMYIFGMVGYALSLPFRVAEAAGKAILWVVSGLLFLVSCGNIVKKHEFWVFTKVFAGSIAEVVSAGIGCFCPIAAYKIDEWVQDDLDIHTYCLTWWDNRANPIYVSNQGRMKRRSAELAQTIERATTLLETSGVGFDDDGMPNTLHAKTAMAFAIYVVEGRVEDLKENPFGLPTVNGGELAKQYLDHALEAWDAMKEHIEPSYLLKYLGLVLTKQSPEVHLEELPVVPGADIIGNMEVFVAEVEGVASGFASNNRGVWNALLNPHVPLRT